MSNKDRFQELARRLASRTAEIEAGRRTQPHLHSVRNVPAHRGMDPLTRESHCKMIRHIRRRWGTAMQELIDQATFGLAGIEQLPDSDLLQLHKDMERAQDCLREGIAFEDAGLIRSMYG